MGEITKKVHDLQHESNGFWYPVTSSIDWCEENYKVSYYVAEFFNSASGLVYFMTAIIIIHQIRRFQLGVQYYIFACLVALVGLGTILFHGTLKYSMQMLDEIPMVFMKLQAISTIATYQELPYLKLFRALLGGSAVVYSVLHALIYPVIIFQVIFGFLMLVTWILPMLHPRYSEIKELHIYYFCVVLISFVFWVVDQVFCDHVKALYLHAWWHFGTSYAALIGFVTMGFFQLRIKCDRREVFIRWDVYGLIPRIVEKEDNSTSAPEKAKNK